MLSSRILLPTDLERSQRFYRDVLGLAVYREFGPPEHPGLVFFLGQGLLEVSGRSDGSVAGPVRIWLQVRDVGAPAAEVAWHRATGQFAACRDGRSDSGHTYGRSSGTSGNHRR
mgnify:FL=1